jgi:hypothetical protein
MPGWSRSRRRDAFGFLNSKRGGNAAFFYAPAFWLQFQTIMIGVCHRGVACLKE